MINTFKLSLIGLLAFAALPTFSATFPAKYIELLDYVQEAPDQGQTSTCLYVASTGAHAKELS